MRLMSFALTERQLLDGSKDVTRRVGWPFLKPGDRLGEKVVRLCVIEVVSARRERLCEMTDEDCAREGFPHFTPGEFIDMFCAHMKVCQTDEVTRIEFRVIGPAPGPAPAPVKPRRPRQTSLFPEVAHG